jgi:hypothetical protein
MRSLQRSIAAIARKAADRLGQARLNDLLGGFDVAREPRQRKAVDPGEIGFEEAPECRLVAGEHPPDEGRVGWRCSGLLHGCLLDERGGKINRDRPVD